MSTDRVAFAGDRLQATFNAESFGGLEAPDDDPHLWLEEIESARVPKWVDAQNAITVQRFNDPGAIADSRLLKSIYDRPDKIPFPTRLGGRLFNIWKDSVNERGIWRSTTLESYCRDAPEWNVHIDLDVLSTIENEDWVWHGAVSLPPSHDLAILQLSRGGADAPDGQPAPQLAPAADHIDRPPTEIRL